MADSEQLEILKRGVKEWNDWRLANHGEKVDLGEADLFGAGLQEADLSRADLSQADLSRANLSGVNLFGADLSRTILSEANLCAADLSGADLSGVKLSQANLPGAKLPQAKLSRADLSGANLSGASLSEAKLPQAKLSRANFYGAKLSRANLSGAKLSQANLSGANLERASLERANLEWAILSWASLFGADLSRAKISEAIFYSSALESLDLSSVEGLENARHQGRSSISVDTLEETAAGLAKDPTRQAAVETFFRGAGVPEDYIEFFRSRIGKPIQFYSCFISHSHKDKPLVRRLYDRLQERGVRCWLDEKDLLVGRKIIDEINRAIRLNDRLLLCCSQASLTSSWVEDEISMAIEKERKEGRLVLIPLDLDGYLFDGWESGHGPRIRERLAADFTPLTEEEKAVWSTYDEKFAHQVERVMRALRPGEGVSEERR